MTKPKHTDTSRSDDLVKMLRSPGAVFYEYGADKGALLHSCADHIEALEAEIKKRGDMVLHMGANTAEMANQYRDRIEALEAQIDRLASFIMHCIEGEPSQSQGAVDTAIRIMTEQATTTGEQLAENERLRGALGNLINAYIVNVNTYRLGGFYTDPETEDEVIEARAALGEK